MTKAEILIQAMALEPQERDEVAEALWQCNAPGEFTAGQIGEVRRRILSLDTGEAQSIPGEHVMQELRERFRQ